MVPWWIPDGTVYRPKERTRTRRGRVSLSSLVGLSLGVPGLLHCHFRASERWRRMRWERVTSHLKPWIRNQSWNPLCLSWCRRCMHAARAPAVVCWSKHMPFFACMHNLQKTHSKTLLNTPVLFSCGSDYVRVGKWHQSLAWEECQASHTNRFKTRSADVESIFSVSIARNCGERERSSGDRTQAQT